MRRFILAVDPGKVTGFAWFDLEPRPEPIVSPLADQLPAQSFLESAESWMTDTGPELVVVCERFTISEGTIRKSRDGAMETIEAIGALRFLAKKYGAEFDLTQKPADAKALVTNDRLRALGWWKTGEDHSRDALRHLALYLVRKGRLRLEVSS